jgi:hypothetical protein
MDGTAVIFFSWSAHMRLKFGTKITPPHEGRSNIAVPFIYKEVHDLGL